MPQLCGSVRPSSGGVSAAQSRPSFGHIAKTRSARSCGNPNRGRCSGLQGLPALARGYANGRVQLCVQRVELCVLGQATLQVTRVPPSVQPQTPEPPFFGLHEQRS